MSPIRYGQEKKIKMKKATVIIFLMVFSIKAISQYEFQDESVWNKLMK